MESLRVNVYRRDPQEAGQSHAAYTQWGRRLDKAFVKINGEKHYLWRAVDHEGEVLETFATKTRNKAAALKFLKKPFCQY